MNSILKYTSFIALFILTSYTFSDPAYSTARENGCYGTATTWIQEIDVTDPTVILDHVLSTCNSSLYWINSYGRTGSNRTRLCNDLVLIKTHKECVYFRDYVSHTAYEPCKSWSREKYKRCMDHDDEWFSH